MSKKKGEKTRKNNEAVMKQIKERLLSEMARVGVKSASVTYEGSGDDGQIENVSVEGPNKDFDPANVAVKVFEIGRSGSDLDTYDPVMKVGPEKEKHLDAALEDFTYEMIDAMGFSGWENNEGGGGEMTIDVKKGKVKLEHRTYYQESETTERDI